MKPIDPTRLQFLAELALKRFFPQVKKAREGLARQIRETLPEVLVNLDTTNRKALAVAEPSARDATEDFAQTLRWALGIYGLARWALDRATQEVDGAALRRILSEHLQSLAASERDRLLLAGIRYAFQRATKTDQELIETSLEPVIKEVIMATPKFYFDNSGVPRDFDKTRQKAFRDAIVQELKDTYGVTGSGKEVLTAAVIGKVLLDEQFVTGSPGFSSSIHKAWRELTKKSNDNDGNEVHHYQIFEAIAEEILKLNGDSIAYQELASVGAYVVDNLERAPLGHPRFGALVRLGINRYVSGRRRLESLELPPLDGIDGSDIEILPDNVRAVGMIRASYHVEQMGLFDVRDRILELNNNGLLAISSGRTAEFLDDTYWNAEDRLSPPARFMLYSRVLGVPGGDVSQEAPVNAEGENLFLRFLAAVSDYFRSLQVSELIRPGGQLRGTEHIRKAGRDLFSNASLFGYGGTFRAARRLGDDITLCFEILGLPDIQRIWGAGNRYQVIERVRARDGQPIPNIVRHRTMAEAEKSIFEIGARHYDVWGRLSGRRLFEEQVGTTSGQALGDGDIPLSDRDELVRQIEYWLAVQGISDQQVDDLSQPTEIALAPSLPSIAAPSGGGAGGGLNGNLDQLRQMVAQGQAPSMEQLKSLLALG